MAYIEDRAGDYKAVSAETLIRLVGDLQPGDLLAVNTVGNLGIWRGAEPVGFVDFGVEAVVLFDQVIGGGS